MIKKVVALIIILSIEVLKIRAFLVLCSVALLSLPYTALGPFKGEFFSFLSFLNFIY